MPYDLVIQGVKVEKDSWAEVVSHIKDHFGTDAAIEDLFERKAVLIKKVTDVTRDARMYFKLGPPKATIDF